MQQQYLKILIITGAAALALAVLAMLVTTPFSLGPLGVTGWFLLILIGFTGVGALIAYVLAKRFSRSNTKPAVLAVAASRRGILIGGYITIIVALSSLRQLNLRDVVLLVLLLGLIEFYAAAHA